jgi:hypothetical protein
MTEEFDPVVNRFRDILPLYFVRMEGRWLKKILVCYLPEDTQRKLHARAKAKKKAQRAKAKRVVSNR